MNNPAALVFTALLRPLPSPGDATLLPAPEVLCDHFISSAFSSYGSALGPKRWAASAPCGKDAWFHRMPSSCFACRSVSDREFRVSRKIFLWFACCAADGVPLVDPPYDACLLARMLSAGLILDPGGVIRVAAGERSAGEGVDVGDGLRPE